MCCKKVNFKFCMAKIFLYFCKRTIKNDMKRIMLMICLNLIIGIMLAANVGGANSCVCNL